MIEMSSEIKELVVALKAAQGMVEGVQRDSKNPHFKSSYASLEAVIDAARPALQANDIAFTQAPGAIVDGAVEVTTMLMHVSGQWLRSTLHVPLGKRDPQGVGSAITYGCRYSLMAALGLPPTDDDGEAAMVRRDNKPKPAASKPLSVHLEPEPEPDYELDDAPILVSSGVGENRKSAYAARKDDRWDSLVASLRACPNMEALHEWTRENEPDIEVLPAGWVTHLREEWKARAYEIKTRG